MNEYQLLEEIGRGTMSRVYKGRKRQTINFYAIHSIDKSLKSRVLNSVRVLKTLNHPNVIGLHEWYETVNHFWVITDLYLSGNMQSILRLNCRMNPKSVRLLGSDVCSGLFYTHTKGLLHRKLKPSSLFMDSTASLVLSDFDLACPWQNAGHGPLIGTPPYIAPEFFVFSAKDALSISSDLWSLGCVLYELASGEPPFKGKDLKELLTNVFTQPVHPIEGLGGDFNELIAHLLEKNPLHRATWKDVLSCGFWGGALEGLSLDMLPACSWIENSTNELKAKEKMQWTESDMHAAVNHAVKAASANYSASSNACGGVDSIENKICIGKELNFSPSKLSNAEILDFSEVRCEGQNQKRKTHSAINRISQNPTSYDLLQSSYNHPNLEQSFSDGCLIITHVDCTVMSNQRRMNGAYAASKLSDSLTQNPLDEQSSEAIRRIPISDLIWCPLDANIRPLWGNKHIERMKAMTFKASEIPFRVIESNNVDKLSERDFESFMRCIYTSLSCHTAKNEQKENILKYLATIINGPILSNRFVNSSIMALCVKMAGSPHLPQSCRMQAASLAGQLVRHASYIAIDLVKANIIPHLLRFFLCEFDIIVKCKLIMCIGELIYYITAQKEHVCEEWEEIEEGVRKVFTLALQTEDLLIRHSAVKAIENLSTNSKRCTIFCSKRIIECLIMVYTLDSSHNQYMRASALSAALRLGTLKDELIPVLLSNKKLPINIAYTELEESLPTPRCVQVLLAFINHIFLKAMISLRNPFALVWTTLPASSSTAVQLNSSLSQYQAEEIINLIIDIKDDLIDYLCNRARGVSDTVVAKLSLFMLLLGCLDGRTFSETCTICQLSFISHLIEAKDSYLQRCISAFLTFLGIYISKKLSSVARGVSPTTTPFYITSLHHLFSSTALLKSIPLRLDVFESLGKCLKESVNSALYRPYEEGFNALALYLVQQLGDVVQHHCVIFSTLVPHYIEMVKKGVGERCLVALYFLTSLMTALVSDFEAPREMDTIFEKWVFRILLNLTDVLPELLLNPDPMPKCALRLVYTCAKWNTSCLSLVTSNQFCRCMWNYLSCVDDVDLFYPLYLLYEAHSQINRKEEEEGGICSVLKQNHLAVLNRISILSMKNGVLHILYICCKLIDAILRALEIDTASHANLQCVVFTNNDAVETVFLPLCTNDSVSIHAAAIIYNLACSCTSMSDLLLSVSGQNALQRALDKQPINTEVVEFLLKAFLHVNEKEEGLGIQHFANDKEFMRALKKATGGDYPMALSSYATQFYRVITDQQVLYIS
ncbi:unnamed protein product [Phytomonas sp. Hart1]|nr:unnamed protein product [Phytomonas sp. Hart1]|eukprot:CCW68742.1 unnamed protein product [Phytomonas sp. isolate Hart1]